MTTLNGPEIFGALVRTIGLYWFSYGLNTAVSAMSPAPGFSIGSYIACGAAQMIVGISLMFKADGVVSTCYADSKPRDDPED